MTKTKLLLFLSTGIFFVFICIVIVFNSNAPRTEIPTPTGVPGKNTPPVRKSTETKALTEEVPLQATPNPTYIQKVRQEPFWNMLPYYDAMNHYVIEYKDSDDKIVITTFGRGQEENFQKDTLSYRQEARDWLQANGARLNQLSIIYNPSDF